MFSLFRDFKPASGDTFLFLLFAFGVVLAIFSPFKWWAGVSMSLAVSLFLFVNNKVLFGIIGLVICALLAVGAFWQESDWLRKALQALEQ